MLSTNEAREFLELPVEKARERFKEMLRLAVVRPDVFPEGRKSLNELLTVVVNEVVEAWNSVTEVGG